jgi:hypothetical protein
MHNTRETMKRILLASASIVAFAGAASAQNIVFGGDAELGFNDVEEDGFFYSADLNVTFSTELTPGVNTTITFAIPVADNAIGDNSNGNNTNNDFVLALVAEGTGGLYFGDTSFAPEIHWDPGFAMASDGFSEQDNETVLRGNGTFFGFDMDVSGIVRDGDNDRPGINSTERDYIDQIALGMSGSVGLFAVDVGYQEKSQIDGSGIDADDGVLGVYDSNNEDFNGDEIVAVAAGATFAGADVKFGYSRNFDNFGDANAADDQGTDSYGVLVRYPFGPVTLSGSYTFEPDYNDNSYKVAADYVSGPISLAAYYQNETGDEEYGVEAVYSQSELTTYYVGYIDDTNEGTEIDGDQDEGFYVAARQGFGNNAYVEASYAEFGDAGPNEVREGTTVLVGLTF